MQSKDLRLREFLNPQGPDGFPHVGSQQMLILSRNPLIELLVGFGEQLGPERTRELLCRFGFKTGLTAALNIGSLYQFDTKAEWLEAGGHLARMVGIAHVEMGTLHIEAEPHRLHVTGRWRDSIAAETWMNRNDRLSTEPVCQVLCALFSGYASAVMGQEVICRETGCQAMGHAACAFEARTAAEWGDRADALRSYEYAQMADIDLSDIPSQARRNLAARSRQVRHLPLASESGPSRPGAAEGLVYCSREMYQVMAMAGKVAPTRASVLIQGESGVGKEEVARYIHNHSQDAEEPFVAVNCAALPPQLLESELFGHVRGAFTGADSSHKGLFVEAGNGTIFLDEIGELSPDLQAKLLRAINEREVRPVGGLKHVPVTARIIAATNQNLRQRMADGTFRQDLFFRLAVFPIEIPPLRRRRGDILMLARHFLEQLAPGHPGLSPETAQRLYAYSWPGNVRELKNWMEFGKVLAGSGMIRPEHLPPPMADGEAVKLPNAFADLSPLKEMESRYARYVIESCGGNRRKAARILGISEVTLWRRIKEGVWAPPEADAMDP